LEKLGNSADQALLLAVNNYFWFMLS